MNINSAELHIQKLLSYVKSLSSVRPTMYEKSKVRLRDLADTCNQVVSIISEILKDDVLLQDEAEFEGLDPEVSETIGTIADKVSSLKSLADSPDVSPSKSAILSKYLTVIHSICEDHCGVEYVDSCADLLDTWFTARFITTAGRTSFRYNIHAIPTWIYNIVISYGASLHSGTSDKFLSDFYVWIQNLTSDPEAVQYGVPYSVHRISKHPVKSDASLESTILWDMLLDRGLDKLCSIDLSVRLNPKYIYDWCGDVQPESLDAYVYYRDYPEILDKLHWPHKEVSI